MKFILPEIKNEKPPKGKRSIIRTVWGNSNAYVSGKFWKTLGPICSYGIEEKEKEWLDGTDNE